MDFNAVNNVAILLPPAQARSFVTNSTVSRQYCRNLVVVVPGTSTLVLIARLVPRVQLE